MVFLDLGDSCGAGAGAGGGAELLWAAAAGGGDSSPGDTWLKVLFLGGDGDSGGAGILTLVCAMARPLIWRHLAVSMRGPRSSWLMEISPRYM